MVSDRAFLFLFHRHHGLLLLYTSRKKSKGPHYQIPGGHLEDEDFDSASAAQVNLNNAREDGTILPYKICASRELYEETGIDFRNSLDRLKPVQLRSTKGSELSCEYKKRIFFSAQVTDEDLFTGRMHAGKSSTIGLTQAMNGIPPNVMLKLSEEHQGFMFERNLSKAAELLTHHSGGKVTTALHMAVENGQIDNLISKSLDDEYSREGENPETPIQCNTVIKRELDMSPCKETMPHDCHRTFYLYLPQIVCLDETSSNETVTYFDKIGTLPVVFVVHCYGCNSETVMTSFLPYSNTHNSIIVAPEGIQRSFNALDCCGYALSSKIDDVGFFSEILATLEKEFAYVKSSFSYAVGWSNGGFMVMHAGSLFKAISPVSGYIVDYDELKTNNTVGKGIFFHHSLDDPFVRSTGCCNDPDTPACCCGIFAERCVFVLDVMKNFASEVNSCDVGEGNSKGDVQLEQSFADTERGITCFTSSSPSCVANSTICLYEHSGHFNSPSFEDAFPMAEQVMDFFARDACEINNGFWNYDRKDCDCRKDSGYRGTYCFDHGPEKGKNTLELADVKDASYKWEPIYNAGILIFVFTVLYVLRHWGGRRKWKEEGELGESDETVELVDTPTRRGL